MSQYNLYFVLFFFMLDSLAEEPLCSCNELTLEEDCKSAVYAKICSWTGSLCSPKSCSNAKDQFSCEAQSYTELFNISRFNSSSANYQAANSLQPIKCYWNGQSCIQWSKCSDISLQNNREGQSCTSYGCTSDGSSQCKDSGQIDLYSKCSDIKTSSICTFYSFENSYCYWNSSCIEIKKDADCALLPQLLCNGRCFWYTGSCIKFNCSKIVSESECYNVMEDSFCQWNNNTCVQVSNSVSCSERTYGAACILKKECYESGFGCLERKCSAHYCLGPMALLVDPDQNQFTFCKPGPENCTEGEASDLSATNCSIMTNYTYSYDQKVCRKCQGSNNSIRHLILGSFVLILMIT